MKILSVIDSISMLTYNIKLTASCQEDIKDLREILKMEQFVFNFASGKHFGAKKNSLVNLHNQVYYKVKEINPNIPSQIIIKGEQACLSAYKTTKANKHKITEKIVKKGLSCRLDKRLYSKPTKDSIKITTIKGRRQFNFKPYPKVKELLEKYPYCDPLIFERKGELFISLTFELPKIELAKQNLALGVDLGMRIVAACSDGRLIRDKKYNKEKRKLRFLKRQLKSATIKKKSKSAKRHLKKLSNKELNKSDNQTHLVANEILKTNANTIVIEDLSNIKKKKKNENKRAIAQVPFFKLRTFLTYKAQNMGKTVIAVPAFYTSQTDSVTGKVEGKRCGRRFYAKSGLVYDADLNAAINIAKKSKLPLSCCSSILDGAGRIVNLPIVDSSVIHKPQSL